MSQWPEPSNENESKRGDRVQNPLSPFPSLEKNKMPKAPFGPGKNGVSHPEQEKKYADLARIKSNNNSKPSPRLPSYDQRKGSSGNTASATMRSNDFRNNPSYKVSFTEGENFNAGSTDLGSYLHTDMGPKSPNLVTSSDSPLIRKKDMRKFRNRSQDGSLLDDQNSRYNGSQKTGSKGDISLNNSRFEEFMQNLQRKKQQLAQEIETQQEISTMQPIYQEESPTRDENTLQFSNAPIEGMFKRRGSPFNVTADKTLFFEDEDRKDYFRETQPEKSAQPDFAGNLSNFSRNQNYGTEEENFKKEGVHHSSFGDEMSINPSFLKEEGLGNRLTTGTRMSLGENPFQGKSYISTELEVELLRAKKETILLEEKLKQKDDEIEELRNSLEETQNEVIKLHEFRDRELKRMKQMEEEFIQQKRMAKSIEQELSQSLQLQSLQVSPEDINSGENLQLLEPYQMIRILKQDRALLRKRVEECDRELENQKIKNEGLRKELNEMHDKIFQKSPSHNDIEQILASYVQEIEGLRTANLKADKKIEELLKEIEERENFFEKQLEGERKKALQLKSEITLIAQEKEKVENLNREIQVQQKIKAAAFKVETDKIKQIVEELAKENHNYRKEIKILTKNKNFQEKMEYLETFYKQQLQLAGKEKESLQRKIKKLEAKMEKIESSRGEKDRKRYGGNMDGQYERSEELLEETKRSKSRGPIMRQLSKEDKFSFDKTEDESFIEQNRGGYDEKNQVDKKEILQLRSHVEEAENNIAVLKKEEEKHLQTISELRTQLEEAQKQITRLKEDEQKYIQQVNELMGAAQSLKAEKIEAEKRITGDYKEKLQAATLTIDNLKVENTILASKDTNAKVAELKKQNEKLQEEIKLLQKSDRNLKQKLEEAGEVNSLHNQTLNLLVQQHEDALKETKERMNKEIENLKEEIKIYKNRLEEKEKQLQNNQQKINQGQNQENEALNEELERQKAIVEKQKEVLKRVNNEIKELKKALQEQEDHLNDVESKKGELQSKVHDQGEEIESFKKYIEAMEAEYTSKEQNYLKQIKALKGK